MIIGMRMGARHRWAGRQLIILLAASMLAFCPGGAFAASETVSSTEGSFRNSLILILVIFFVVLSYYFWAGRKMSTYPRGRAASSRRTRL